jgi:hypothetical protein
MTTLSDLMPKRVPALSLASFITLGAFVWADEPANHRHEEDSADFQKSGAIESLWLQFATRNIDSQAKQRLLDHGEAALESLIDILYGDRSRDGWPSRLDSDGEKRLWVAATELLDTAWPPEQVRNVVRRRLDVLAKLESVQHRADERPLTPLLASLRHSPDDQDRALLGEFVESAQDAPALTAMSLMQFGYRGRIRSDLAEHWKDVPEHDYSATYWKCLDPARPQILFIAMHRLPRTEELIERLELILDDPLDPDLRERICRRLYPESQEAKQYYLDRIAASDEEGFRHAVQFILVENSVGRYRTDLPVLDALRSVLEGNDANRRKYLLERISKLEGIHAVPATEMVAPLLLCHDPFERVLAADALLRIDQGHLVGERLVRSRSLEKVQKETVDPRVRALLSDLAEAPNQTLHELSGHPRPPAPPPTPQIGYEDRRVILGLWHKWARLDRSVDSVAKDPATRDRLIAGGEASIEILLDLLYGPSASSLAEDEIQDLVEQLAANEFRTREAATEKLIAAGSSIRPLLEKYADHSNAEIRARVEYVRAYYEKPAWVEDDHALKLLKEGASQILARDWPPEQMRAVVKRNFDRLANARLGSDPPWSQPLEPLLRSLRFSPVPADRGLLGEFALKADERPALVSLQLLELTGFEIPSGAPIERWTPLPYYNYLDRLKQISEDHGSAAVREKAESLHAFWRAARRSGPEE